MLELSVDAYSRVESIVHSSVSKIRLKIPYITVKYSLVYSRVEQCSECTKAYYDSLTDSSH